MGIYMPVKIRVPRDCRSWAFYTATPYAVHDDDYITF